MPDLGAVSSQTAMDAAAFIADQHAPVDGGPARLCKTHTRWKRRFVFSDAGELLPFMGVGLSLS